MVKPENLLWRSRSIATQNKRGLNQAILHLWCKFGDLSLNMWRIMVWTRSKLGKVRLLSWIWPWRSRLTAPKTIKKNKVFCIFGLNFVILVWMVPELSCGQASDWYTHRHTDTQTDAGNDNTRRPKLAKGKNWCHCVFVLNKRHDISGWHLKLPASQTIVHVNNKESALCGMNHLVTSRSLLSLSVSDGKSVKKKTLS